jgi:hypothetical protein
MLRRILSLSLLAGGLFAAGVGLVALVEACVPADDRPTPGSVTFTVSPSPAVANGVVTADGWKIGFERVLIGIGSARLGDGCNSYSEANYDRVLDVTKESGQKLSILHGIGQCDIRFRVGTPSSDALLGAGVTEDDKSAMRTPGADPYVPLNGIALSVAGVATRGDVTKRFTLVFRPRVRYANCRLDADASIAVDLQSNVDQVFDIRIEGEAVLRDDVDASTARLRFDPFAAADTNGDGNVTLDELRQVPISSIKDAGAFEAGSYEFDEDAGVFKLGKTIVISTLGDYVYELLMPTLPRFRDIGTCTAGLGGRGGLGAPPAN